MAPAEENSGAGHSLSLADPIRYRKLGERRFEVAGTPTDCVVMAVRKILPGMPDLVLSGVNRGQNIADDVTYSGTIAAAMEGTLLGLKSIALSQVTGIHGNGFSYEVAEQYGTGVVKKLMAMTFGPGVLMNVNFPDCRPDERAGRRSDAAGQARREPAARSTSASMRAATTITGSASSASAAIRPSAPISGPPSTSASRSRRCT